MAKWHFLIFFYDYFDILGPKVLVHLIEPNTRFGNGKQNSIVPYIPILTEIIAALIRAARCTGSRSARSAVVGKAWLTKK